MLLSANLDSGNFLIERYLLWNKSRDESDFAEINAAVESMFREMLPEVNFPPLYEEKESSAQLEIYDELAGLSAAKHLLGPSKDMKNIISESFHASTTLIILNIYSTRTSLTNLSGPSNKNTDSKPAGKPEEALNDLTSFL